MSITSSVLRGFSRAIPPKAITNQDLSKLMDTSDEWIVQRTGIRTRYWVESPVTTSDLGAESAKKTLNITGVSQVDAVIAGTLSPDYGFPGIGVQIQAKLGLPQVPAYDLRNQCSGFLYGVEMADALIRSGVYKRILLIGSEVHSTGLDLSTRGRDIAVLFGDGAGSCIVEAKECEGKGIGFEVLGTELHGDGNYVKELWCEHPGSSHFPTRITEDLITNGQCFPRMNGKRVFEHAVKKMTEVSMSLLEKLKINLSEISIFLPHQANLRINQMVGNQLGLSESQVFNTIHEFGNTTAASIPIGFSRYLEEKTPKAGDIVLSAAFGSGFTWGAAVFRVV